MNTPVVLVTGGLTGIGRATALAFANTNVLGTLLSLKHELRVMTGQKSGSIINISSTYGHEGAANATVYAASDRFAATARSCGWSD